MKKILIAGAGVAGLEAAVTLAKRGCTPIVLEQSDRPGGLLNLAKLPPDKDAIWQMAAMRLEALEKLGVAIQYNTPVTVEKVRELSPDAVILATGSVAVMPPIEGVNGPRVYTGDQVLTEVCDLGENVCVLGGGLVGCEVSEYLGERGKRLTIIEMGEAVATALNPRMRAATYQKLGGYNVDIRVSTKVMKVSLPALTLDTAGYAYTISGFDSLVVAAGRRPAGKLKAQLEEAFPTLPLYPVGDAVRSGMSSDAVVSAAAAAKELPLE